MYDTMSAVCVVELLDELDVTSEERRNFLTTVPNLI